MLDCKVCKFLFKICNAGDGLVLDYSRGCTEECTPAEGSTP